MLPSLSAQRSLWSDARRRAGVGVDGDGQSAELPRFGSDASNDGQSEEEGEADEDRSECIDDRLVGSEIVRGGDDREHQRGEGNQRCRCPAVVPARQYRGARSKRHYQPDDI